MKFKHLLFTGVIGMAAASCSNDVINPDENLPVLENETTAFVKVSIVGDRATRVVEAGYQDGSEDESQVNRILLTFFDAAQNYVGTTDVKVTENNIEFNGNGGTVERVVTVIAQVDLPKDITYPKYVIAYVNPTTASDDLATEQLNDARYFIRNRSSISTNGRTMNNAVYFDEDSGEQVFATEVDFDKNFYKTYEDAKKEDANAIEITVERMEAKVKLNDIDVIKDKVAAIKTGDEEYTLTFVPEAWFVNGIEKRSFLLKNYSSDRYNYLSGNKPKGENDAYFTLSEINKNFINSNSANKRDANFSINDEPNTRSYWAIDPTYFMECIKDDEYVYPTVSYDVKYNGVNTQKGHEYPLLYRSYENVLNEYETKPKSNYVQFSGNKKTHEYVTENTMSFTTLRSTDAKAAMTSVVLLGHYIITDNAGEIVFDGSAANSSNNAFYVHHGADGKKSVMLNDESAIDFFLERNVNELFVQERDEDGNIVENEFVPLTAAYVKSGKYGVTYADFSLIYPDKAIIGKTLSEQWRTLTLNKVDNKYNDNIYLPDGDGYKKLNEKNDTEINNYLKGLYSNRYGVVERFESGKAYFNVPLRHVWADLNSNDNTFKPDKVRLGDYGVVRNHIYDLEIEGIAGWGTGIGDLKQPIVPPTENEQYYISTRLKILKWHVVGQKVKL